MKRALAPLAWALLWASCNGQFRFDEPRPDAGVGPDATVNNQAGASGAADGERGGGGNGGGGGIAGSDDPSTGGSGGNTAGAAGDAGTPDSGVPDAGTGGAPDAGSGCVNDVDCKYSTLHCDARRGLCVECRTDADCKSSVAPHCNPDIDRCVECHYDENCPPYWRCERAIGRCYMPCSQSSPACPAGEACYIPAGHCSYCPYHSCGPNQDCDYGVCSPCLSSRDCTNRARPYCFHEQSQCVECYMAAHCREGEACEPSTNLCVKIF